jgi:hypothetical protein
VTAAEKNLTQRLAAVQSACAGLLKTEHKIWAAEVEAGRKDTADTMLKDALGDIADVREEMLKAARFAFVQELAAEEKQAAVARTEVDAVKADLGAALEAKLEDEAQERELDTWIATEPVDAPVIASEASPERPAEQGDIVRVLECGQLVQSHRGAVGVLVSFDAETGDALVALNAPRSNCVAKAWELVPVVVSP